MLKPRTIVDYNRECLYTNQVMFITLITNVSGIFVIIFDKNSPTIKIPNNDVIILEVKFDEFLPDLIKDIIQTNTRKATSISKYANSRMFG